MFVGERVEEAGDSLLGRAVFVKDGQQPLLDVGPVVVEDRRGETLFTGEVRVERAFRHAGGVGDVFDTAGGEPAGMYEVEALCEQAVAHFGVRRAWHAINSSRPVAYSWLMDAQELTRELAHPDAQQLLSGSLARLACNGPDNFPRVIPIGFYWTGERIVVCTAPTAPKVAALSARPHVALTIDTPDGAKALLVRGLASMETVDGIPDEYLAAAAKSFEEPQLAEFERNVRAIYKQMVRISIEPKWARYYDFGAGRLPAFLARLVESAR